MTKTEAENIPNPLPTRFSGVKEKRDLINQGLVLKPLDRDELFDISNASQSIVAGPVLTEVMERWEDYDIELSKDNFYRGFCLLYFRKIKTYEKEAWLKLTDSVVNDEDIDLNKLTPVQAAVLTLQSLKGYEENALSSKELFVELAMHAEQYERLLQEKLAEEYSSAVFYDHLREHFPTFLKRMIAMDSLVIDLYRRNAPEQDRETEEPIMYAGSKLDSRFYTLDEDEKFKIKPEFINALKKWANEKGFTSDSLGRTENRGCPFLLSEGRDEFIEFAIEEFIKQHKKVFATAEN